MQRTRATALLDTDDGRDTGPTPEPQLRTEFDFELPRGYVDAEGVVHRHGTMRLATARDELLPLYDERVQENPAFTTVVLLGRVITRLGTVGVMNAQVVENMFASDVAFLQDFYRRIRAHRAWSLGSKTTHWVPSRIDSSR